MTPTLEHTIKSTSLDEADEDLLVGIINSAFEPKGKTLVDNYFSLVSKYNPDVYLIDKKKAVAITYDLDDFTYLCKAAVPPEHQKKGIGSFFMHYLIEKTMGL